MTAAAALADWLGSRALPLWSTRGVDPAGGFHEAVSPEGVVIDAPRRCRLVARQVYVFATAERLGWDGPARALVRHGLDFLTAHLLRDDGVALCSVAADGRPLDDGFDLYDQAFALFGMAAAAAIGERGDELADRSVRLREALRTRFAHPLGGFEESLPPSTPLKANPHMHLLEAALAWEALGADPGWAAFADDIASLALARFRSAETGAVHECFDYEWRPLPTPPFDLVEPGHQFEWAWLLARWGRSRGRNDAVATAARLIAIGERHGVSATDLAVNALGPDLAIRDDRHRLWPQTERMKAAAAFGDAATVERATAGLLRFLDHPVPGAWWEHLDAAGAPVREPSRASSLYHIVCAAEEIGCRP